MKKYLLLSILLGSFILFGCFDEDEIHADLETYKRAYDTTSTDPVWKYVSQYYYKYGKLFITDPDTSDYLFNFQYKYSLWMQEPKQTTEHLLKGIQFVEEMLLNGFSDDFKREYFPFNIILADSIAYTGGTSTKWDPRNIYCTKYHVSLQISEKLLNMTEEEKEELSTKWNLSFLLDFCSAYGKGFNVPEDFYAVSREFRGRYQGAQLPKEEWYERGYIAGITVGHFKPFWDPDNGYDYTDFPNYDDTDFKYFFTGMITIPNEELQEIAENYPRVKARLEILDAELKKIGIDYRNMGYRAKN